MVEIVVELNLSQWEGTTDHSTYFGTESEWYSNPGPLY